MNLISTIKYYTFSVSYLETNFTNIKNQLIEKIDKLEDLNNESSCKKSLIKSIDKLKEICDYFLVNLKYWVKNYDKTYALNINKLVLINFIRFDALIKLYKKKYNDLDLSYFPYEFNKNEEIILQFLSYNDDDSNLINKDYNSYAKIAINNLTRHKYELRNSKKIETKKIDFITKAYFTSEELKFFQLIIKPEDINDTFEDLCGLEDLKKKLDINLLSKLKHNNFDNMINGVLLEGPPGCGKTMIAKCIAKEANMHFLNIKRADIVDKYYGVNEKNVKSIFSLARKITPCIIFIDEIECLLKKRCNHFIISSKSKIDDQIVSSFLEEMDGIKENPGVIVLGATNLSYTIDEAIKDRMSLKFHVPKPNADSISRILYKNILKNLDNEKTKKNDVNIKTICKDLAKILFAKKYNGRQIIHLCKKVFNERQYNAGKKGEERNKNCNDSYIIKYLEYEDLKIESFTNNINET
mgnify:CR=1 FL=1|jgi:SpoVK/Ycf46/Vps4 family AAA+-type ATPase